MKWQTLPPFSKKFDFIIFTEDFRIHLNIYSLMGSCTSAKLKVVKPNQLEELKKPPKPNANKLGMRDIKGFRKEESLD